MIDFDFCKEKKKTTFLQQAIQKSFFLKGNTQIRVIEMQLNTSLYNLGLRQNYLAKYCHKSTIDPLQTNLIKLWEMAGLLYFRYVIHVTGKPVAPRKSKQPKHHPPGLGYIVDVLILDPSEKEKNIFFILTSDASKIKPNRMCPCAFITTFWQFERYFQFKVIFKKNVKNHCP